MHHDESAKTRCLKNIAMSLITDAMILDLSFAYGDIDICYYSNEANFLFMFCCFNSCSIHNLWEFLKFKQIFSKIRYTRNLILERNFCWEHEKFVANGKYARFFCVNAHMAEYKENELTSVIYAILEFPQCGAHVV